MEMRSGPLGNDDRAGDQADRSGGDSQRSRKRESFFLMAKLSLIDEKVGRDVRIRNLSEGGLMIEVARMLDVGTPVKLDLRGIGEVTGKVAWYAEGRAGVALDHAIDPAKARKPVGQGGQTPDYAKPVRPV